MLPNFCTFISTRNPGNKRETSKFEPQQSDTLRQVLSFFGQVLCSGSLDPWASQPGLALAPAVPCMLLLCISPLVAPSSCSVLLHLPLPLQWLYPLVLHSYSLLQLLLQPYSPFSHTRTISDFHMIRLPLLPQVIIVVCLLGQTKYWWADKTSP